MLFTKSEFTRRNAVHYIDLHTREIARAESYIDFREYVLLAGLLTLGYSRSANQLGLF
jgi:hypothetical protein